MMEEVEWREEIAALAKNAPLHRSSRSLAMLRPKSGLDDNKNRNRGSMGHQAKQKRMLRFKIEPD